VSTEVKAMEVKKPQQQSSAPAPAQVLSVRRIREFIDALKGEIERITWTNRDELIVYTKIVVGATFVFGMSIYVLDLLIQGVLAGLNFVLGFISG